MNFLLSLILVLVFYFGFAIPISATIFVPQVAFLFLAAYFVFRRPDFLVVIAAVASSSFLLAWICFAAPTNTENFKRILSGGQLVYTLVVTALVATSKPFDEKNAKRISLYCLSWGGLFCFLGLLEIATPFKLVSDRVRDILYGASAYAQDVRDVGLAGFVRPKVFTSEPSHAAWGVSMLALIAFGLQPNKKELLKCLALLGVATLVFYSPNPAISAIFLTLISVVFLWDSRRGAGSLAAVAIIAVVGALVLGSALFAMVRGRIAGGVEDSIYIRIVQPFKLVSASLDVSLLTGIGYGGLESIWTEIDVFDGGVNAENLNRNSGMALLTIPLFTGLSGVFLFCLLLGWIFKRWGGQRGFGIAAVLVFCLLQKQSFVITTAWITAAFWALQAPAWPIGLARPVERVNRRETGRESLAKTTAGNSSTSSR